MPTVPQPRTVSTVIQGDHDRYQTIGDPFASGGLGELYRTDKTGYVYKRYKDPTKAPDVGQLELLVTTGRQILITESSKVGRNGPSSINWPVDLVRGPGGVTAGVILPTIPPACFDRGVIRGLEALIMARARPPRAEARVALLIRMAEILAYLDKASLVHGDISGKNLAWSIAPEPLMYLIDCDGLVPQRPAPAVGVCTNYWTDPRLAANVIPAHDQYSDRYALALAIYRGLLLTIGNLKQNAHGKWAKPTQLHQISNSNIRSMLASALEQPLKTDRRPTPQQWVDALQSAFVVAGNWNAAALDELDAVSNRNTEEHRKLTGPVPVQPTKVLPKPPPVAAKQIPPKRVAPKQVTVPPKPAPAPPTKTPSVRAPALRAGRTELLRSAAVYLAIFCALGAIVAKNVPIVARFLANFRIQLAVLVVAAPSLAFGVVWAVRRYLLARSGRADSPLWFRVPVIATSFAPMVAGTWGHLWGSRTTFDDLPTGDRWQQAAWFWRLCAPALAAIAALFAFERAGYTNRRRASYALVGLALLVPVFTQGRPVVRSVADRARLLDTSIVSAAAPVASPETSAPKVAQSPPVPSLLVDGNFDAGATYWPTLPVSDGQMNALGYPGGVDGGTFLEFNTSTALGSIYQDVATSAHPAQPLTFTVWLRSPTGSPADLSVTLSGMDGVSESSAMPVSLADSTWQQISVTLTPSAAHATLRAEIYLGTPNVNVDVDQATLT